MKSIGVHMGCKTMKTKYIPRMDTVALKVEECNRCGQLSMIDVHAFYGLPEHGWKMCGVCGYDPTKKNKDLGVNNNEQNPDFVEITP